jgi:nitrate/nitrite transport system ATP-binding protein
MSFLQIRDVSVRFGSYLALDGVSLDVARGEVVTLIGHSGCGKSSLLNLVAGLNRPTEGSIYCDGAPLLGPGPDRGVVFQNHSLLPWMTCLDNVLLGVDRVFRHSLDKARRRAKAEAALRLVHLDHAMHRYPAEISGGMKQRVGIARAIAIEPRLLLLDEPFGALDALTRASLQDELLGIVDALGATVLMVTHDVDEAILLSDRVVMMTNGPAARLGEILSVDLPRPRDRLAIAADPACVAYRQAMIRFLHGKHRRVDA